MTVNNQQKAGVTITEEMVKKRRKEGEGGVRRIEKEGLRLRGEGELGIEGREEGGIWNCFLLLVSAMHLVV